MVLALSLYGKYLPNQYSTLSAISEEVRRKIREILASKGNLRSGKLVEKTCKDCNCSQKPVYRELEILVRSGEIRSIVHNRGKVEYELVELSDFIDDILKNLSSYLENINTRLDSFHEKMVDKKTNLPYFQRLSYIVFSIKQLQKIEARLRILSSFSAIKKSKSFKNFEIEIEKTWEYISALISHQNDSKILNEVLMNFSPIIMEDFESLDPKSLKS